MQSPDFWSNQEQAAKVSQQAAEIKREITEWHDLRKQSKELAELAQEAEGSEKSEGKEMQGLTAEIGTELERLQKKYQKLEIALLFSGKYDNYPALLAIHAGTGGVDAQDWAQMLLRMYLRYAERQNWQVKILDQQYGNEAGIKSATLEIQGAHAYGKLKGEAGTHRLVRISPFDAEKMRHTSFALAEVLPDLGKVAEIEIKPEDLRIDAFRSSGPGGQSVNTTDSAVRIVHLPTKISVSCQSERSQHQNKERAMQILKAKLHALEELKKQEAKHELRGEYREAKWGSQIRSYVLQPYQMVKDHRTEYETSQVDKVLNGELDEFIEEYLKNIRH